MHMLYLSIPYQEGGLPNLSLTTKSQSDFGMDIAAYSKFTLSVRGV